MSQDMPVFQQLGNAQFQGGAWGLGEVFRLLHGDTPVVLEVFQDFDAIRRQAFPAPVIRHLRRQVVFLGFQGTQEERQPRQPVGGFLVECALGAAQGEVVG